MTRNRYPPWLTRAMIKAGVLLLSKRPLLSETDPMVARNHCETALAKAEIEQARTRIRVAQIMKERP
jgi:hypothetical protein